MDVTRYKDLFVEEASSNLHEMGKSLERACGSTENRSEIDVLFRHAHSIKGMAASLGYTPISEISHKTEDLMEKVRSGKLDFTPGIGKLLFEAIDQLQTMVDMVASNLEDFPDPSPLIEKLIEAKDPKKEPPKPISPPKPKIPPDLEGPELALSLQDPLKKDFRLYRIQVIISKESMAPAARAFLLIMELEDVGEVKKSHPQRKDIEMGQMGHELWLVLASGSGKEKVEKVLRSSTELESFKVSEIQIEPPKAKTKERRGISLDAEEEKKPHMPSLPAYRKPVSVKVDTPDLDNLINIIGEMMIQEERLTNYLGSHESGELKNHHLELHRSIKKIHGQVMKFRMMPIASLVDMLPRVIRRLQRGTGKEVELSVLGKDVKLDRAILEELGDPLLHLARNSIDHGLEPPDEREKLGKDPCGKLSVTAWKEKDLAFIQIEDDGRGMDPGKIKAKAVEKGIITRKKAEEMTDGEALMLVCSPGLSTAEKVTDISGRGVGMDVVKTAIESMGGGIFIESTIGKGTKFILKLPMTLAIIKTFLVRVGGALLSVPLTKLHFVEEVRLSDIRVKNGERSFLRRDEWIPMVHFSPLLKLHAPSLNGRNYESVMCVEIANRKLGLVVDDLLSGMETVVKPLGEPLSRLGYYSGVVVTGTGEMALVLDVERFAGHFKQVNGRRPGKRQAS